MCRLLAFASSTSMAISSLLTPDELENYRAMSTLHGDGWGAAAWTVDDQVTTVNSVERAIDDATFDSVVASPATAGIVHLRWATAGLPVCLENTHPFSIGGWSFAHNGSFPHHERLLNELSAERRSELRGTTDSELYAALVVQRAQELGDIVAGLRSAIATIRDVCGLGSLNCLILQPGRLIAAQAVDATKAPVQSLRAAVSHEDELPEGHDENYYRLRYTVRDGSFLVASTGVATDGWQTLDDDTIIDVDVAAGQATLLALDTAEVRSRVTFSSAAVS